MVDITTPGGGGQAGAHTHPESDVTNLTADLAALTTAVAGKAAASHTHGLADIGFLFARKTADEVVNNSNTFQDDDHLTIPVAASGVYVVQGHVIYDSSATADMKFRLTAPAGAECFWRIFSVGSAASATPATTDHAARTLGAGNPTPGGIGVSTQLVIRLDGLLIVGATPGNLAIQWAQQTAEATDTTVRTGSFLLLQKVA